MALALLLFCMLHKLCKEERINQSININNSSNSTILVRTLVLGYICQVNQSINQSDESDDKQRKKKEGKETRLIILTPPPTARRLNACFDSD